MMVNGGVEEQLHSFLTLALDGDQWSASCHSCFTPSTHGIQGWVDPQTLLVKVLYQ
jgi:hypothetical protein